MMIVRSKRAHCFRDGIENLGDIVDLFLRIRIPAQVDVVGELLHGENIDEDGSGDLDIGTGNRNDDARAARYVPYLIVL
jgi:hypothetical protein